MNDAIYEELKDVASQHRTVEYGQLAPLAKLDMNNPGDRNEIAAVLGEISQHEHTQGRPLLSVIVVAKETGVPGQGFFNLAKDLGVYLGGDDDAFFVRELRRAYEQWSEVS